MRYCRCQPPSPQNIEGLQICAECGDRVPDPLLLLVAQQQAKILAKLTKLEEGREERQPDTGLLEPAELAERLGKSRAWIYEHADELGAIRLGEGPRPRLLFDPELARERLAALAGRNGAAPSSPRPSKRRRRRTPKDTELLPVKGSPTRKAA